MSGPDLVIPSIPVTQAFMSSCYRNIDFQIDEGKSVFEAVEIFSKYNIGCLTVTKKGQLTGVISERDYVTKIALLGRSSKTTKVIEIATMKPKLIVAKTTDSVDDCMRLMLAKDIRHLPLVDKSETCVGLISIKDLLKIILKEKEDVINTLVCFNTGQGGSFMHT